MHVWYDLLANFRLKNQVISFSRCSSRADSVALTCSTAMPVHPETTWDVARLPGTSTRQLHGSSVSSQQKYSHTMFVQRFTLIISHFQTITSKNSQKNISLFFSKHFFWRKIFNDEFWYSTSMPGPRPRWWRARAASRCVGWGPSAPSAASPGSWWCGKMWEFSCNLQVPSIHLVVYASYNTYYMYI